MLELRNNYFQLKVPFEVTFLQNNYFYEELMNDSV